MKNNLIKEKEGPKLQGRITLIATDAKTGEVTQIVTQKNLIMIGSLTGFDLLVQYLLGSMAPAGANASLAGGVNYGLLGTSNTPPAVTDTQLGAEAARTPVALAVDNANQTAKLQFFFTDAALSNTTYYEAGCVVNGTGSANTGKLVNHALFATPYIKTAGNNTTMEIDFAFSAA